MKLTLRAPLAAALALAACSPHFDPASKVDRLRVLGIQAEPPEIEPPYLTTIAADRATLRSLVLSPNFVDDPSRTTTIVHLACIPKPGDPTPSVCVALASLLDPTVLLAQAAEAFCARAAGGAGSAGGIPPILPAGAEACIGTQCGAATVGTVTLPPPEVALSGELGAQVATAFENLPEGSPERVLGVEAVVLAFAIDATPDELVASVGATACVLGDVASVLGKMAIGISQLWQSREHVLSTKRIQIRGPDLPDSELPNENPAVAFDPPDATTVEPGTNTLAARSDTEPQQYTRRDAAGAIIEAATEEYVYSWFATEGELQDLHTRDATDEWTISATPGGSAFVAVVVRDLRGGIGWAVREVMVVPPP